MTAKTQNPYAAPASEVRDDAADRPVLSRAGRALLWLALGGNLLMGATAIHATFVAISDGYWHWPNAIRLSLAALNIAALFKRTAAILLWLSAVPNALFAVAVTLSVAALISFRDGMAPDAAELAQASVMGAVPVGLLCLLTVVTVFMNRGRS